MTLGDTQWGQGLLLLAVRKDCRVILAFRHADSMLTWAIFVFHYNVLFGILPWGCFLNDGSCSRKGLKGKLRGLKTEVNELPKRGAYEIGT